MHRGFGLFGGMGGWFGLFILAFVIYFLVKLFTDNQNKNNNQTNTPSASKNQALDILNERYAKGEIDEEEYERRKNTLQK